MSLSTSGMYLGSTLAMAYLPGLVAAHGPVRLIAGIGALGLAWVGFWLYVLGREAHVADYDQVPVGKGKKAGRVEVPWGELLRQPAVWAICANNFTFHYVLYVLMNWLPTYFERLLHAELSHRGLIKTLLNLAVPDRSAFASSSPLPARHRPPRHERLRPGVRHRWGREVAGN